MEEGKKQVQGNGFASLKPSSMKRKSEGGNGTDWIKAVHEVLRLLSSYCDGAHDRDNMGFNKFDAIHGHFMANLPGLDIEHARRARKMLYKYHRQIPQDLWYRIYKNKK